MKILRRVLLAIVSLVALALVVLAYLANSHPSLEPYRDLVRSTKGGDASGFTVTYLGVSTLLFDDGETAILTDGFFSRPGKLKTLLTRIEPDRDVIARDLERAGIKRLAAVIPLHSHYDHALDSPVVAERTGALLIGSESTANIGRGYGLAEDRIVVARDGAVLKLGRFTIHFIRSRHVPSPAALEGEITAPLHPPARVDDYREGGCYTLLVEHGDRSVLVQASAGFVEGALRGLHADVVYLGVGLLGNQDDAYRDRYWREVVRSVGAQRVIPIHWDDFNLPLDQPLQPSPRLFNDFDRVMGFLIDRALKDGVDLELPQAWLKVDPYAGT